MRLKAKNNRVVLKPLEYEERFQGGIIVSDNGKEKANIYEVISVGPGVYNALTGTFIPNESVVGEKVYVHKALVTEITIDGETFCVTRDAEILGSLEEDENGTLYISGDDTPF